VKAKKNALDQSKKVDSDVKQEELATKKEDAFTRLKTTIKLSPSLEELPATDLKLAFHHLGGKVANMARRRPTFLY